MNKHPENDAVINEIIDEINSIEITDVWCDGCQMIRQMNKVYEPYVSKLRSCRFCRSDESVL